MILNDELREKITNILDNDGVIAFVTDTVWGIGCLAESEKAVKKIYEIKGREQEKPLILMSDEIYPLLDYVKDIPKKGQQLVKKYFPGALTLVVQKSEKTPHYITSGLDTVGIRVPDNDVFAEICRCTKSRVLATTSANLSHQPAALSYEDAIEAIGDRVDLVVEDYNHKAQGRASTVAGFKNNEVIIFRQGDIRFIE